MSAPRVHWREAALDGALIGLFLVSACAFGTLLEAEASPVRSGVPDPLVRRALMGAAMGLTAVALIYSPWGRRSGAQMNPAITLAFTRLGRMPRRDAPAYVIAQLIGAALGVALMGLALGPPLALPPVRFVETVPGPLGAWPAFGAELLLSATLMLVVLETSTRERLAPWTGAIAGALVATWIFVEAPISGMSLNPARTLGSALAAGRLEHLWIYSVAPPLGMWLAAEIHARRACASAPDACAKLCHGHDRFCHFCAAREPSRATHHSQPATAE